MVRHYDAQVSGKRIRQLRKEHKDTQASLAEKLNVSVDTVKRIENGVGCSVDLLLMIADLYQVSTDYLIHGAVGNIELEASLEGCKKEDRNIIFRMVIAAAREMKGLA